MRLVDRLNELTERMGLDELLATNLQHLGLDVESASEGLYGGDSVILIFTDGSRCVLSDGHNLIGGERYPAGIWVECAL